MDRKHTGRRIPQVLQAARAMRKNSTPAERVLWNELRDHRFCDVPFRRQHPLDRFVLDFYCPSRKLAIEVDGEIHDHQREHDEERTKALAARGIRVIRFRNEDVLERLDEVLQTLRSEILTPGADPRR
ncbi:MAG TPA: endonuclease domain-containing protein [Longimicrobium sp.]